jgi:tricarballylate dehydrogenase
MRAPPFDGGICTRIDASLGVVVNREAKRFYDEGEDFWPKRYAIWGRLVAQQPGQIGYSIIDAKAIGRFMPPVFPGTRADTLPELARALQLDVATFVDTVEAFNRACRIGTFDQPAGRLPTAGRPQDPLGGRSIPAVLRLRAAPGITFTYLGLRPTRARRCLGGGQPQPVRRRRDDGH